MRIATKVFAVILATVLVGVTSVLGMAAWLVLNDFEELEEERAHRDLARVDDIFAAELSDLGATAREFADISGALLNNNGTDGNATADLAVSLFLAGRVDLLYFFVPEPSEGMPATADGRGMFAMQFDRGTFAFGTPTAAANTTIMDADFLRGADLLSPAAGVVDVDGVIAAAASYPFRAFDGQADALLVLVRPFDDVFLADVRAQTGLDARLTPWSDLGADDRAALLDGERLTRNGLDTITAEHLVWEDSLPVVAVAIQEDRAIFRGGLASIMILGATGYVASALLTGAIVLLVRGIVTGRVASFSKQVRAIQAGDDRMRIEIDGNDELGALAGAFNELLAKVEDQAEALRRSNGELTAFASSVTHDLKSPLSTFAMNLAMLKQGLGTEASARDVERVERMERGARKMAYRIDHLLDYARVDAAMETRQIELADLLLRVIEDLQADIDASQATVQVGTLPSLPGDPELLAQVMQNLVGNAIKYRHPDRTPEIQVWAEGRRQEWHIHVADNGRGFDPQDAEKMMSRHGRLDNAADVQGKGLGLATCVGILAHHGGRLMARGGVGKGALFTVVLPRRPASGGADASAMTRDAPSNAAREV